MTSTTSTPALLPRPTVLTLYHTLHFSSSRPLGVLMELGLVSTEATPSTNNDQEKDNDNGSSSRKKLKTEEVPVVKVQTVTYEQLKKDPILTELNPQKRLPFFYDPDQNLGLTESGGLVEYLLERFDTNHTLHPAPGHATRADFLQLLHFGPATAYHMNVPILFEAKDMDKKIKEVHDIFVPMLERALIKYGGPFLLGNKLSAVDISLAYDLMTLDSSKSADVIFDPHPELKAYHDMLKTLPFYKAIFPKDE